MCVWKANQRGRSWVCRLILTKELRSFIACRILLPSSMELEAMGRCYQPPFPWSADMQRRVRTSEGRRIRCSLLVVCTTRSPPRLNARSIHLLSAETRAPLLYRDTTHVITRIGTGWSHRIAAVEHSRMITSAQQPSKSITHFSSAVQPDEVKGYIEMYPCLYHQHTPTSPSLLDQ